MTPSLRAAIGEWFEPAIFLVGLAAIVSLICSFRYFPSQDGPNHMAIARVIADYHNHAYSVFSDYFEFNFSSFTNIGYYILLVGLNSLLPEQVSEKVLLVSYVLTFAFSFRYLMKSLAPGAVSLAPLILPFILNLLVYVGYFNMVFSLALVPLVFGYWWRHQARRDAGFLCGLTALSALQVIFHPLPAVMTIGFAAFAAFWLGAGAWFNAARTKGVGGLAVEIGNRWYPIIVMSVPTIAGLALMLDNKHGQALQPLTFFVVRMRLANDIRALLQMSVLQPFNEMDVTVARTLSLLLAAGSSWLLWTKTVERRLGRDELFLVLAGTCSAMVLLSPRQYSMPIRLQIYSYLALLCWLIVSRPPRWLVVGLQCGSFAVCMGQIAALEPIHARANAQLAALASAADSMAPNSTLLGYNGRRLTELPSPLVHAENYLAAERHLASLTLSQAEDPFFPIRYRADRDPAHFLGIGRAFPWKIQDRPNPQQYAAVTGGTVDYVLISDPPAADAVPPALHSLFAALTTDYDLIFRCEDPEPALLYRRRTFITPDAHPSLIECTRNR